jgi:2',3'-cyclic-nucleotide 2'-phosphodiesterase (5'-nucleotidase family)
LLGGLARRVAYEEKLRTEKQGVLTVDSGDLFFAPSSGASSEKDLAKARLISRAYKHMGAAAINVGDLDLLQGVDFLRSEYSQGLPLISANLLNPATKAPIFSSYVIRQAAGVRVAYFGLLQSEFPPGARSTVKNANEGKILIKDPVEAARETVQKLKGQADLIILLSDLGLYKDQTVAQVVPGIHFILGGHEGRFTKKSQQTGSTHILQSSVKGMYVGQLRLVFENPASAFKDEGEAQSIQERINALDFHLRSLQGAKERPAGQNMENIDRSIQDVTKQKNALQEELKRAQNSSSQGNRFLFTLEPMEARLPEDEGVRKWIAEAGIDKD